MKRLGFFLIGVLFLFPNLTSAKAENLQFTFRHHCEDDALNCNPEITEKDDVFFLPQATGTPMKIDLVIENPKREMITSVRAKLKFNSEDILVTDLDTQDSDFNLAAPNENDIDEDEGTVMIGRSFTGGSKSNQEFFVGTLTISALKNGAKLEFMNFQDTELGDTGIFFTSGLTTENRLREEPKNLQIGDDGTMVQDQPNVNVEPIITNPYIPKETFLPRPSGLRIQTDDQSNVRLIWPIGEDASIKGYYLYYSQKSGYYLRRRDVGKTNFALFPNLPAGEKYFFAIKAYNEFDQESDYSNEVSVTVGMPGSESAGFTGDPTKTPETAEDVAEKTNQKVPKMTSEDVDKTVDSGPEHIFFFLIISMGITFLTLAFKRT